MLQEKDKKKHFFLSALLALVVHVVFNGISRRRWITMSRPRKKKIVVAVTLLITLLIGGVKELFDSMQIGFPPFYDCPCRAEFNDFLADVLGVILGVVIAVCLDFLVDVVSRNERNGEDATGVEEEEGAHLQIDII